MKTTKNATRAELLFSAHKMKKIFDTLSPLFFLSLPLAVFAFSVFFLGETAFADQLDLVNPIPGVTTLEGFIKIALAVIIKVLLPIAVIFLVYSGFQFITAMGDTTKLKTAKESFKWAVVGTAVLLGSWALVTAIQGTIVALGA